MDGALALQLDSLASFMWYGVKGRAGRKNLQDFASKKLQWAEPQAIIFPTLPFHVPL
jgi:hypothetical protein